MIRKSIFIILMLAVIIGCGSSKHRLSKKEYSQLISMDSIHGVYIPNDLEDAFRALGQLLSEDDIAYIKNLENRDSTITMHHGLGMWLRNNWGLWGGSRMQKYMLDRGVSHPDGMSSTILEFYYDWLNEEHTGWKQFHESSQTNKGS